MRNAMCCPRSGRRAVRARTCCPTIFRRGWGCSRLTPAHRSPPAAGRWPVPPRTAPERGAGRAGRGAGRICPEPAARSPCRRRLFWRLLLLNYAALAAQHLRDAGLSRVAVLDVNYHHGNGTQSIYERPDVFFASIHGRPAAPNARFPYLRARQSETGAGAGARLQPEPAAAHGTGFEAWSAALEVALAAISRFRAEALVVSLGLDTSVGDPISGFCLQSTDYLRLGERLARVGLPTVLVLEGGYAVDGMRVNTVNVQAFA